MWAIIFFSGSNYHKLHVQYSSSMMETFISGGVINFLVWLSYIQFSKDRLFPFDEFLNDGSEPCAAIRVPVEQNRGRWKSRNCLCEIGRYLVFIKQDGAATCAQVHRLSVILGIYSISSGILFLE